MNKLRKRLAGDRSEAGETLLEVLLSTALLAVVVVGLIGGLAVTVLGAHIHREQADANASLTAAMERVKSPALSRIPCAVASDYLATAQAATPALPSGWAISIESVEYQNYADGAVSFGGTCNETATNTLTLQRITLKLTTADNRVTPTLSFVKGDY